MLKRSENLNGYSIFIGKVNEYKEYLTLDESVTNAVKYCIEWNVLRGFLEEHGSEVVNMLFDDISIEEIAAIRYTEGREDGREEGRNEGRTDERQIIARNLLTKGSTPEFVHEITGLEINTIREFSVKQEPAFA